MAFKQLTKGDELKPGDHWITVQHGMRGFFACEMWINNQEPDLGPFPEPWQSDPCSFGSEEDAKEYAIALAKSEDLPYLF